jgi:phosphoribosyl-ATP pyrophosphohydrolase
VSNNVDATMPGGSEGFLSRLSRTISDRQHGDVETSYVAKLYAKGEDAALKKVGEEAAEFIMAAKDASRAALYSEPLDARSKMQAKLVAEAADVWFHTLVALARHDLGAAEVIAELARREGMSGLEEKAARPQP